MSTKEQAAALLEAYSDDRLGRPYKFWDRDVYTMKGYHRGQDVRKQNERKTASVVSDVVSLSAGKVVYVGRPNDLLELTIVVDTGRPKGRYESHSHNAGQVIRKGQQVAAGEKLARNADDDENPGTAWGGPHDHLVISDYIDGAWMNRPEYDPLPFIEAARKAAAAVIARKPGTVYVVTRATFLRSKATTAKSSVLFALEVGRRLRVIGLNTLWAKILRQDGRIAWVWRARLTKEKLVTTRSTPLRAAASVTGRLIRQLPKGTRVTVIGPAQNGRVKVRVGSSTGWAYRKHLK
jgi:hypothetical protein